MPAATVNTPAAAPAAPDNVKRTRTGTRISATAVCNRNDSKGRTRSKLRRRNTHASTCGRTHIHQRQRAQDSDSYGTGTGSTRPGGGGVSALMAFGVLRRVRSEFAKRSSGRTPVPLTRSESANASTTPAAKGTAEGKGNADRKGTANGGGKKVRMRSFARRHHDKAADLAELELDPDRKAAAYMVAADAAMRYNMFDSAERHLRAALRNIGRADPDTLHGTEVTECLTLLGIVLDRAGKPELAEQALRDCIACSQHAESVLPSPQPDGKSTITDIAYFVLAGILERAPPSPSDGAQGKARTQTRSSSSHRTRKRPGSRSETRTGIATPNRTTEAAKIRSKLRAITVPIVHF